MGKCQLCRNTLMRRLPVRPDADLDDQRHLELCHVTHQPGQVGADFDQFIVRHLKYQFVMDLQDEAGFQA